MHINIDTIPKMLISFLLSSSSLAFAGVTDDLMLAVETGDLKRVEQALANGAERDAVRSSDGHSAKSLAILKLQETPQAPFIVSGIAAWALPVVGLINNPKYALLSLLSMMAGFKLGTSTQPGITEKLQKVYAGPILTYAGFAGILASAWHSNENTLSLIASSMGTAGLAALFYQSNQALKRIQIIQLLTPEEELPLLSEHTA